MAACDPEHLKLMQGSVLFLQLLASPNTAGTNTTSDKATMIKRMSRRISKVVGKKKRVDFTEKLSIHESDLVYIYIYIYID